MTKSLDHENPSATDDDHRGVTLRYGVAVVVLYFGTFAAILLDEVVLRTNWMNRIFDLSDSTQEFLRLIYAPLIWLTLRFL